MPRQHIPLIIVRHHIPGAILMFEKSLKDATRSLQYRLSLLRIFQASKMQVFLTKGCLATAMEYCNGGDMLDYVVKRGGLPEASSRYAQPGSNLGLMSTLQVIGMDMHC